MYLAKQFYFGLLVAIASLASAHANAKDIVIAISPYGTVEATKKQAVTILDFILSLKPGDHATVIDGYQLKTIGEFTIPIDPRYKGKKVRINLNKKGLIGLLNFAKNVTTPNSDGHPSNNGALKLPQLLRYSGQSFNRGRGLDVLVIGSALYEDPREPSFTTSANVYLGDGHLSQSRGTSPFGTLNDKGSLEGVRIHIVFTDSETNLPDRMQYHVNRFSTLYIDTLGGKLISFVGEPSRAFDAIKRDVKAPSHTHKRKDTDKMSMIRLRPIELETSQSIFERPINTRALSSKELIHARSVELGISWDNCKSCDLDLYSMANPSAQILYFGHTKSPHGRYWKDYTNAPVANGFETISYHVPLDLRALRVGVNFYGGKAINGVNGEVRVSVNGQTFAAPFKINARKGIGSGGATKIVKNGRSNRPQTLIVDILKIVAESTS